jgi:hypothetical protein
MLYPTKHIPGIETHDLIAIHLEAAQPMPRSGSDVLRYRYIREHDFVIVINQ